MKPLKLKTKAKFLQVGGVAATFAPLAVGIGMNWQDYFATKETGVSLTVGGVMALVIVIINALGKGKAVFGNGFIVSGVVFALCLLLEPLVLNLKFLTGMMFLGEGINTAVFKPAVTSAKKQIENSERTEALREAIHGKRT